MNAPETFVPAAITRRDWRWLALVFLAAALPYLGTLGADFTNWDDPTYVTDNPDIRGFSRENTSAWISRDYLGNRAPVLLASYALDYSLWGLSPTGFHLTNVLLQGLCAALLWAFARRLGLTALASTAGALVFALHPVGVEVVAWVAERKTLLAACFMLGALLAYLRAEGRGAARWGALAVALFALGAFSKVAVAPFPFVLIALHLCRPLAWSRTRVSVIVLSLAISTGAGLLTIAAHHSDQAVGHLLGGGLSVHAQAVSVSIVRYALKLILPLQLSPYYDMRLEDLTSTAVIAGGLGIGLAVLTCGVLLVRRHPYGFWLSGALLMWLPTSGVLIPISTPVADRYLYLPLLFLGPLVAIVAHGMSSGRSRRYFRFGAAAVLCLFALLTLLQSSHWRASRPLWSRAVEVEPRNPWVRQKLAYTLWVEGDARAALAHAKVAAAVAPHWLEGLETLGRVALDAGEPRTAEAAFRQQIGIAPRAVNAYVGLARARSALGDDEEALHAYIEALRLKRDLESAARGVYELAVKNGREEELLSALPRAPTSVWIDLVRGDLLARMGRAEEAEELWRKILLARPGFEPAMKRLSPAGETRGQRNELTGAAPSE